MLEELSALHHEKSMMAINVYDFANGKPDSVWHMNLKVKSKMDMCFLNYDKKLDVADEWVPF